MAETSAIEWCDATVNFWWGCSKVSPGCDNCYAEAWNAFRGTGEWGPGAPRRPIKGSVALIRKLNRISPLDFFTDHGRLMRVFVQSMSDTFDNEIDDAWRTVLFSELEQARWIHTILLTKRIGNVAGMVPPPWLEGRWPRHIGLMISVCTQREANRDIKKLRDLKKRLGIPWVGISFEPMIEPITPPAIDGIDWIIVGGESGKKGQVTRPLHPKWVWNIQHACTRAGVAFFFQQWGDWLPEGEADTAVVADLRRRGVETIELHADPSPFASVRFDTRTMYRAGKRLSGGLLGGHEYRAFPKELLS